MQPTHLNGAQLFSLDIFSFEILTFIEIEIDITTSGHGLKYDFYFSLFIKSDFFKFSALVLTQKTWNVGCLSKILPRTSLITLHTACLNAIWYHFLGIY